MCRLFRFGKPIFVKKLKCLTEKKHKHSKLEQNISAGLSKFHCNRSEERFGRKKQKLQEFLKYCLRFGAKNSRSSSNVSSAGFSQFYPKRLEEGFISYSCIRKNNYFIIFRRICKMQENLFIFKHLQT